MQHPGCRGCWSPRMHAFSMQGTGAPREAMPQTQAARGCLRKDVRVCCSTWDGGRLFPGVLAARMREMLAWGVGGTWDAAPWMQMPGEAAPRDVGTPRGWQKCVSPPMLTASSCPSS